MGFAQHCTTSNHSKILALFPLVMICVFMFGCGNDDDGNDNPFLNVADDLAGSAWVNSADSTDTLRFLLEPFEQTLDFMNPGAMVNTTRRIYNRCSYELYIEIIDENHIDVDFVNKVVKSTYGYYLGTPPEDQVMDYDMNDELDKFTISGFTGSLESSYWEDITFIKSRNSGSRSMRLYSLSQVTTCLSAPFSSRACFHPGAGPW